jgi:bifunctional non-homologous end joining protein LigD
VSLEEYRRKRHAARTPEPMPPDHADSIPPDLASDAAGPAPPERDPGPAAPGRDSTAPGGGGVFVVQEHHARGLHWDFRLEHDGVLASWAVPKGVPDDPARDHFARRTEDHPLAYAGFSGVIPRGEYGAGTVSIWDRGGYELVKWTPREVKVVLHGRRLSGGYALYRTRDDDWMIHRERVSLPEWVPPMLATSSKVLAGDEGWAYEMKWDGVRASAYLSGGRLLRLVSRSGQDVTVAYPELRGLGPAAGPRQLVLDGEIVAFDGGRPSFEALQPRIHVTSAVEAAQMARRTPVVYLAFDLLYLDWRPTLDLPYRQRRALLDDLALAGPSWQTPPAFTDAAGADVLAAASAQGLEGVVAKRLDARYRPGARSADWLKFKPEVGQEAVVGGINPGKGRRAGQIGSLLVGVQSEDGLAYAGRVGTGFNAQSLQLLDQRLAPLRRATSPFATPVPPEHARGALWVEPRLVIAVAFAGWTQAGRMRAPSYRGLRADKDPAEVIREQ